MTLGDRIKECRKKSGLSQDKVAELVGVSRQAVTKWEAGQTAPNTENLFKLAEIFGTTVDLLISEKDADSNSPAEQIYYLYKMEEEKKKAERQHSIKRNAVFAAVLVGSMLTMYLILQFVLGTPKTSSVMGLITGTSSKSYLWGWLIHNKLFWLACGISVIPALWGKWRFSVTTAVMIFGGVLLGELFGPYPAGSEYGQDHYGWAIWLLCYFSSMVMGMIAEKMKKKGIAINSKQFVVWLVAMGCCCILSILIVLLNRPVYI